MRCKRSFNGTLATLCAYTSQFFHFRIGFGIYMLCSTRSKEYHKMQINFHSFKYEKIPHPTNIQTQTNTHEFFNVLINVHNIKGSLRGDKRHVEDPIVCSNELLPQNNKMRPFQPFLLPSHTLTTVVPSLFLSSLERGQKLAY